MRQVPQTKVGQMLDLMRECIRTGEWDQHMPSERELADRFMVSRTTLRKAIEALERDGLVSKISSTRERRRISCNPGGNAVPSHSQVIFLTPTLRGSSAIHEHLANLREKLGPMGMLVHVHEAESLMERKRPLADLRRIASRRPHAIWVLHRMPVAVQQAVAGEKWPAVVFGSVFPGVDLPGVDLDFRSVARHAAGTCLGRGCGRMVLLIHRTMLAGDVEMVEAVTSVLASKGERAPEILRHDFNRARLLDGLDRLLPELTKKGTVLMISNQHHLLTAVTHLMHRGVQIPKDMGLLYLGNDSVAERISPLPCRYDSGQALVRRLSSAIKSWSWGQIPRSGLVVPRFLDGQTLPPVS